MINRGPWIVHRGPRKFIRFAFATLGVSLLITVNGARGTVHAASRVEIRNKQFYVDGEPFYVRAVGYSGLRPHQRPDASYTSVNHTLIENDFARIRAAHFNTLRSFDALSREELEMAQKAGLMVLQGIWMDRRFDFSDSHNLEAAVAAVQRVADESKDFDNVLGYLVMSKPYPTAVLDSGIPETIQFFRRLKRSIQTLDPRPVSFDNWLPLAFLDQGESDFSTFTAFPYWPRAINEAMGFPGYVRWLSDHFGADRPFILGATGGYGVAPSTPSADGGVGGLTEYNQSLRDLESLRGAVEGHADGAVLVSFLDSWQAGGDPDTHDESPWEWNGIVGIPTDQREDLIGKPRIALKDVTAHNEIVVLEPHANHYYPVLTSIPIQVATADNITGVRFTINGGDYTSLEGSGHGGWHGFFRLPKLARKRQRLTVQALDPHQAVIMEKDISFLAALSPEKVLIEPSSDAKDALSFRIKVRDSQLQPIAERKITYGFFLPVSQREIGGTGMTNAQGELTVRCSLVPQKGDRYLYLAAGTKRPENVTASDLRIFTLGH